LEISSGYDLIDFNVLNYEFDSNSDFYDSGHTSFKGANRLTQLFSQLYNEKDT